MMVGRVANSNSAVPASRGKASEDIDDDDADNNNTKGSCKLSNMPELGL